MNSSHDSWVDDVLAEHNDGVTQRMTAMAHGPGSNESLIVNGMELSEELLGRLQHHSAEDFEAASVELGLESGLKLLESFGTDGERQLVPALVDELRAVRARCSAVETLALNEMETMESLRAKVRELKRGTPSRNSAGTIAASIRIVRGSKVLALQLSPEDRQTVNAATQGQKNVPVVVVEPQSTEPRKVCLSIDNHQDRYDLTEEMTKKLFDMTRENAARLSRGCAGKADDSWVDQQVNAHNKSITDEMIA